LTDIPKIEHCVVLTRNRQERRLKGGSPHGRYDDFDLFVCSSRNGNYDNMCGSTAVGNRADSFQFCKYGGRQVVGVSSCLPANSCVVSGSECPVLAQNGVWGSAALFGKQNVRVFWNSDRAKINQT
jgi:hypothetical protein